MFHNLFKNHLPVPPKEDKTPTMTDAVTDVVEEVEEAVDELNYIYLSDGLPLFLGVIEKSLDTAVGHAKDMGHTSFYILGDHTPVDANKKVLPARPIVFKVVMNTVSLSVYPVEPDAKLGFDHIDVNAHFRLPKIPWEMVERLDSFFRRVDEEKGGSEAIVVLGFDERCDDATGWRIMVPTQRNTAAYCNYDPASVVDVISDEDIDYVQQVGTIHSHPGMSAFASHTDAGDQYNNDGLHITFGWPRSTNKTEFHIEVQAGGIKWTFQPDAIFEQPPKKDFPELNEWVSRVTKDVTPPLVQGANKTKTTTGGTVTTSSGLGYTILPGAPDPKKFIIVASLLRPDAVACPVCALALSPDLIDKRRCSRCDSYLALPDEDIDQLIRIRKATNHTVFELTGTGYGVATKKIAFWHRNEDKSKSYISYIDSGTTNSGKF